ncbi:tripartite tricarboxylate transporter TctB family protein [Sporosarcina sp. NPDC096371]|uniref:tripartite tricarboxylate transporter TctB family protein n=1 Tax=Sporosarcina sp. NPDC096371 TaxID=3364530 RepID=UPI0038150207
MKKEISDISTGIVLLLFSIIGYVMATDLASPNVAMKYGPDFFPKLVLSLLAITSLILVVNAIRRYKKSTEYLGLDKSVVFTVLIFVFILIGYVLLFFVAGFIISTIVFLFIGQWAFGIRKIALLSTTSIVIPIALYFLFSFFFKVPLP